MTENDLTPISRYIWETKYRLVDGSTVREQDIQATWRRVASALARVEGGQEAHYEDRFYRLLDGFRFLPGGRILAGAGSGHQVTLFNCFVMGEIDDSIDGIFDALKQGAITMQQGGGVGYDFSSLRPLGVQAHRVGTIASGPVSFMRIWDSMCATILSTGARRGAMMATLRCDHPDIEMFIDAKRDPRELRHFNLSVLVSDDFMAAVEHGEDWPLMFPLLADDVTDANTEIVQRPWPGRQGQVPCRIYRRLSARALWDKLMHATYEYAEPGVLFIDRINRLNTLNYREQIIGTNPCGEIPLPSYGACDLGAINLTRFVRQPFTVQAGLDFFSIAEFAAQAVRFLDNVIDVSQFPLPEQRAQAHGSRRIGLGLTGLADMLIMLGMHYDSDEARDTAAAVMQTICHSAYRASIALAGEKGPFPYLDCERYLQGEFARTLPEDIRDGIARQGIRNSHLTAIAPTGTISLLANNISSGLEPVHSFYSRRRILVDNGCFQEFSVEDDAHHRWQVLYPQRALPDYFVTAAQLPPRAHLAMQAALQPYVDNAISKTITVPENYEFDAFRDLYHQAFKLGLKGCTTFRSNPVTGSVLLEEGGGGESSHCCNLEREAD